MNTIMSYHVVQPLPGYEAWTTPFLTPGTKLTTLNNQTLEVVGGGDGGSIKIQGAGSSADIQKKDLYACKVSEAGGCLVAVARSLQLRHSLTPCGTYSAVAILLRLCFDLLLLAAPAIVRSCSKAVYSHRRLVLSLTQLLANTSNNVSFHHEAADMLCKNLVSWLAVLSACAQPCRTSTACCIHCQDPPECDGL